VLVRRARDRVIGELRDQHARDGVLPALVVREAAAALGSSPRSVRRWLAAGTPSGHKSTVLIDDELYGAYLQWHGNVAATRRELVRAGRQPPALRTLQRAFGRELRPAERAAARTGDAGLRAHGLYVKWEADHRNEVWQGDHKKLDVLVAPPRGKHPARPWSTMFVDARSRVIMGWALSLRPSAAEVLAALRDAMTIQPDVPAVGGVPERLRVDHGLEFCAESIRAAALALNVDFSLATEYTPEEKGKIERLHLTCVQTFLSGLPLYTGGRRDRKGRLEDPRAPLPLQEFVSRFADWVEDYNHRPHSELGGESPASTFASDPTPLRTLPVADARALLAARKEARVHRYGVAHACHKYTSPDLSDLVGEMVEIAFAPHDERSVEVYWRNEWICTALPHETLNEEQERDVIHARKEHAKEVRRRQRAATKAARTRLAPMTASDRELAEVSRPRAGELDVVRARSLATAARTDLLITRAGPPRARRAS
jgi:putative transposase